ncbi:MAG: sigma-70 family RNA polymerase sigma factor [Proteobacteria bacterium]|nr:sigma-70 family RNA polymerase sigma factor [Pseudomonadota bacterium]
MSRRAFPGTRWSLVLRAGDGKRAALEELCTVYWYPLYAYVRSRGHSFEGAQDLTQGFFLRLLGRDDLSGVKADRGRFRSFLLTALKHYLADEWDKATAQKRGGKAVLYALDCVEGERRYQEEPADLRSPDAVFERRWALALINEVLGRLGEEYDSRGQKEVFDGLSPYLTGANQGTPYRIVARSLGRSVTWVKVAVHRMRKRFGEVLREEVAQTVENPKEVDLEIKELMLILSD